MKSARSIALVLLALAALSAVASAYEPIADSKVPSAKAAVKPETAPVSRKLLQGAAKANTNMESVGQPKTMWGGYLVTPPFWASGMKAEGAAPSNDDATARRFDMSSK